jgi:hypothetical protein
MTIQVLKLIRWMLLVFIGLLTLYKLFIIFLLSGALVPHSSEFGLVCLTSLAKVPAVVFANRHRLPLVIAGLADWLMTTWVFQIQEQHATIAVAFQNSFLDLAFVLLAIFYLILPNPRSGAASEPVS